MMLRHLGWIDLASLILQRCLSTSGKVDVDRQSFSVGSQASFSGVGFMLGDQFALSTHFVVREGKLPDYAYCEKLRTYNPQSDVT